MKNLVFVFLFSFFLTACSSEMDAARLSNTKTIGIVSAMGDVLSCDFVGTTVLTDGHDVADIKAWNLDGFVLQQMASRLGSNYKILIDIDISTSAYLTLNGDSAWSLDWKKDLANALRQTLGPQAPSVDLWILVNKGVTQDNIVQNHNVSGMGMGIGISQRYLLFGAGDVWEYTAGNINIFDGHTFELLAHEQLITSRDIAGVTTPFVSTSLKSTEHGCAQLSQEDKQVVYKNATQLLNTSIDYTLRDMKFIK